MSFFVACTLLAVLGLPRDRTLWSILAASSVLNLAVDTLVFEYFDGAWIVAYCGLLECFVIAMLYRCAWTAKGQLVSMAYGFLCIWHSVFWLDFTVGSYFIYDFYNEVILAMAIGILTLGTDGAKHAALKLLSGMGGISAVHRSVGISRSNGLPMGKGQRNL